MAELEQELRAAREVIAVLQRRIEREAAKRDPLGLSTHKAIASLENTVDLRTRALEESEAHYRALFDHSPNLAFLVDDIGIILRANATATALLGEGAVLDRPVLELFEGEAREAVERLLSEEEGEAHELHFSSGRIVDVGISRVPGADRHQVIIRDVTARAELAQELQHARRLASIGHLAAGVAHEINNPLAALQLGLTELATRSEESAFIDELLSHCDRIARIVANLRTFAEPHSTERTRVPVCELVASARTLSARALGKLDLKVSICPDDLAVHVDRAQLEQVMVNLLNNSGRALAECGGEIELDARAHGDRVNIRVTDSGPGFDPELLDQVFTPFVSGGPRLGMGLGLSISWGLVQENEGTIRAFNRPEGGACIELELPLAEEPTASPPPEPEPVEPPPLRVLCVEDEPSLRRSLIRLLEIFGHQATGVEMAEEALSLLAQGEFDLVISDVRLPGMSGEQLRDHIQTKFPGLARRVLLMSGFFPEGETHNFLQKPFNLRQLNAAIQAVLAPDTSL